MSIYTRTLLTQKIMMPIEHVGSNIKEVLETHLKTMVEGKCCKDGYIKRNSSKIISYSCGVALGAFVVIEVAFECQVCFPTERTILQCVATNITKAGIRATVKGEDPSPIDIFVAKDHHYNNTASFNKIVKGTEFEARVIGNRIELEDTCVSVIAELL